MTDLKKCNHYWNYVHAVYSGPRGAFSVRRWCTKCGAESVGTITKWRKPRLNEFDHSAEESRNE